MTRQPTILRIWIPATLIAVAIALSGEKRGTACDTPVYRYAMYNWTPSFYHVLYVHEKSEDEADVAVNGMLDDAGRGQAAANILFRRIDVANEDALAAEPREVQAAIAQLEDVPRPFHLIFSPRGSVLFADRLDTDAAKQLLDSPARQQIASLLDAGNAGVLLLFKTGSDEANAAAESEVRAAIERASAGEIVPFTLGGPEVVDPEDEQSLRVGLVVVDPHDPDESWLTTMLLGVEDDLDDYEEPMVFGVYGRGRASWPYLGGGIQAENLNECIAFMSGACSCEVKEQNPGMDLLIEWNWEATAEALARQFPDDEGQELYRVDELFPAIVAAPPATDSGTGDDSASEAADAGRAETSEETAVELAAVDASSVEGANESAEGDRTQSAAERVASAQDASASSVAEQRPPDDAGEFTNRVSVGLGWLVGGSFVVALLLSLVFVRGRAS